MKPHKAWRGALEVEINGVPLTVSIEFYARSKKQRNESFRTLGPSGQPVKQQYIDPATGKVVEREQTRKGYEKSKGEFVVMTDDALAKIDEGVKTTVIPAETFCPLDSIALDLALDRFAVRPNEEVPRSGEALNIVWNGLRESRLAWCAQVSLRGGHDAILVLYADDVGMWAALLPFEDELYPVPVFEFEQNAKAAKLFSQMVENEHEVEAFDHESYVSEYRARRQAAIDAVVAGAPVTVASPPKAKETGVDLMAALESSAKKPKPKKAPAKTKKAA